MKPAVSVSLLHPVPTGGLWSRYGSRVKFLAENGGTTSWRDDVIIPFLPRVGGMMSLFLNPLPVHMHRSLPSNRVL